MRQVRADSTCECPDLVSITTFHGWQCQLDTIKWGSLTKDEEKIRDAKEIERMYSDLVSLLGQGFKITIVQHFQLPDIKCFSKFFF